MYTCNPEYWTQKLKKKIVFQLIFSRACVLRTTTLLNYSSHRVIIFNIRVVLGKLTHSNGLLYRNQN